MRSIEPRAGLRQTKEQKRISDPPDTAGEPLAKLTQAGLTRHQFILVTGFFFDLPAARLLPPDLADERCGMAGMQDRPLMASAGWFICSSIMGNQGLQTWKKGFLWR